MRTPAVAALLIAIGLAAIASDTPVLANDHEPAGKQASPFSSVIASVMDAYQSPDIGDGGSVDALTEPGSGVSALVTAGLLRVSDGKLQLYVHADAIDQALRDGLAALGAVVERESLELGIVQASVPFVSLAGLADLPGLRAVTEPSYGVLNVGANLTEGDAILDFDALRSAQGVDGTGVTVGVISDGIAGLQTAVSSGDLPATGESRSGGVLTSTSGGVIATSFRADGDLEAGFSGDGAEGTAILEIVHDIAPGAQLRFANFETSLEFMAAVDSSRASAKWASTTSAGSPARQTNQATCQSTPPTP